MTDKIPDFYKQAVYHAFHGVIDIRYPNMRGAHNNVLFVKTNEGDYTTKFISHDMALKNSAAARLMSAHGIPVPESRILNCGDAWIERYPLIPGKTLHEQVRIGMSEEQIRRAYEDILTHFVAMENIPISKFVVAAKTREVHNMAYENVKATNGTVMATVMRPLAYLANCGRSRNTALLHSDITPKNVIVDENGRLVSFLDLDGVTLCNRSYAFAVMADKWRELGFNPTELYDKYEIMAGKPLNRGRINAMLNAVHFMKTMMYHTSKLRGK